MGEEIDKQIENLEKRLAEKREERDEFIQQMDEIVNKNTLLQQITPCQQM